MKVKILCNFWKMLLLLFGFFAGISSVGTFSLHSTLRGKDFHAKRSEVHNFIIYGKVFPAGNLHLANEDMQ